MREISDGVSESEQIVNLYISSPGCSTTPKEAAVLYLTDVFGIQLAQNKLSVGLCDPVRIFKANLQVIDSRTVSLGLGT